jgi:5-methylcytosine-specific restriction endonuclease McrA
MISWQKALILWFQGKVDVLEFHSFAARSTRELFRLPSVLRLKKFVSPRKRPRIRFSRENIYLRDGYCCQYCGQKFNARDLTLDHVVPASQRGRKDWTNVVTACRPCNHRKANRTPLGAGMPLLSEPKIPAWLPVAAAESFSLNQVPEAWKPYLLGFFER